MGKKSFEEIEEIMKSIDTHLGRQILINLKKNPEKIYQVNVTTGESETQRSMMLRSIRVAQALTSRGIGVEKVLMICGNTHNDLTIPVISSLYIGTAVISLSMRMTEIEIKNNVTMAKPDILFCDAEKLMIFKKILEEMNMSIEIVVFGNEIPNGNFTPFMDLTKPTGTEDKFQATNFDPTTTDAFIILSSGTTDSPKGVCLTHQNFGTPILLPTILGEYSLNIDISVFSYSPFVWITGLLLCTMSAVLGITRFQTHLPFTPELAIDVIRKYKKYVINGNVSNLYGLSEVSGIVSIPQRYKRGSCGKIVPWIKWKIEDTETGEELGPHKVGELVVKSPWVIFKCYYNNPESTAAVFDDDGWYHTGDLLYYDEDEYFYIVDRMSEVIKFRLNQVAPTELEHEIMKIPGVYEVCVVGLSHTYDGQHLAAIVQLKPGSDVTIKDVQKIVEDNLSEIKHLRGGVVFIDKMPHTHSGKINRKAINDIKESLFNVQ